MPTHIPNNAVVKIGAVATARRPAARLGNSFVKAILPVGFRPYLPAALYSLLKVRLWSNHDYASNQVWTALLVVKRATEATQPLLPVLKSDVNGSGEVARREYEWEYGDVSFPPLVPGRHG